MIGSLANSDVKLDSITQTIEKEVFQVGLFVHLYLPLDSIIQVIRRTVWKAKSYVEHVQLQLNMLSLGHLSPSVITPISLKGLLLEIQNHLPPEYLKLPYDPKGEIWKLHQTCTCITVFCKGRFLVIVSIPLFDNMNTFEICNIFNMSVSSCTHR